MSEKSETEIITKEPEQKIERIKDPKKVAAGKRLAQYHKKAKQALENNNIVEEDNNSQWLPEISLTTGLTLIGLGLTAIDLYFRWKSNNQTPNNEELPKINNEAVPKINNEVVKPVVQPSRIPKRIGME